MTKEKWHWKIRCLNESDYELMLDFVVQESFFMDVYTKGVYHMARAHGKTAHGNPELIDEFDVEESYLGKVKLFVKKVFEITRADVLKMSQRQLMNYNVKGVHYKRQGKEWLMTVTLSGVYARK